MLTYSIATERLSRSVGDARFDLRAVSGGGLGSKAGKAEYHPSSWSTSRQASKSKKVRGGPIPAGHYSAMKPARHPRLGRSSFLAQTATALLQVDPSSSVGLRVTSRGGFLIHGRGRNGSDDGFVSKTRTA